MSEKRAIIYARVSGDDTKKDGRNLDSQIEMGREYAQAQGYQIVAELKEDDRGASGADWDLPQLNRSLEMARAGEFDVLIVRELDRFARRLAKQLVVETEFKQAGVSVEYILATYDESPEGQLSKNVRAIIAEYERLKINERMERGRRNKVKSGQVTGCSFPYGYRLAVVDGKQTFEIQESEARIIRLIYEWYTTERIGARGIAKRLTDMRVSTYSANHPERCAPRKRENWRWSAISITRILANETYCGFWHYNDLTVQVPAIISRETREAARQRASENKERAKRNRKNSYLLSGRVRCGECRAKMIALTSKSISKGVEYVYGYYKCRAAEHPFDYAEPKSCHSPYFRTDIVDRLVWERVELWLSNPELTTQAFTQYQAEKSIENKPLTDRLALINDQLETVKAKLGRLLDLRVEGEIDKEMYQDRKGQLEHLRMGLDREKTAIEATIQERTLTQEQIDDILAFSTTIRRGFTKADCVHKMEMLDNIRLEVVLVVEHSQKVAYLYSVFPKERLLLENTAILGQCAIEKSAACVR